MRETVRDEEVGGGEGGQFGGVRFVVCCGILAVAGLMSGACQWHGGEPKTVNSKTKSDGSRAGGKMAKQKEGVAS